jgi:hypothetical protein
VIAWPFKEVFKVIINIIKALLEKLVIIEVVLS